MGGVGCNLRLQEMMQSMADERGASLCAMDYRLVECCGVRVVYGRVRVSIGRI